MNSTRHPPYQKYLLKNNEDNDLVNQEKESVIYDDNGNNKKNAKSEGNVQIQSHEIKIEKDVLGSKSSINKPQK